MLLDVTTVHKEIDKIAPEGLVDDSGLLHKVDILICATGFNIAFAPPLYETCREHFWAITDI
jgi:hypothetical protein